MSPDLNSLKAFARVAQLRSFRKAANSLNLSPSALSHAITRLEEELGVRLLSRTTRSVSPTAAGARLLSQLAPAFQDIGDALDTLNDDRTQLRGRLRLNVPRAAARLVFAPKLASWTTAYPELSLEITSNDAVVDIVDLGFDAGMRFGELLQQDMVAVPVGPPIRFVVCAAPGYLKQHGVPATPDALLGYQCLQFQFPSGVHFRWEFEQDGQALSVATTGMLVADDLPTLLQAALDGAGMCYMYEAYAIPHLRQGALQQVLTDAMPPAERFYLYYPSRRHMPAGLRALIDFLK